MVNCNRSQSVTSRSESPFLRLLANLFGDIEGQLLLRDRMPKDILRGNHRMAQLSLKLQPSILGNIPSSEAQFAACFLPSVKTNW